MGSPLGPHFANAFLCYHETKWLDDCPTDFKPLYYRRYVDDIFAMFKSPEHVEQFHSYMNTKHNSLSFTFEQEENGSLSFLDVKVSREDDSFITSIFRKSTFSGVYTNFRSFLPFEYKTNVIMTLLYRLFTLSFNWKTFHQEIKKLRHIS